MYSPSGNEGTGVGCFSGFGDGFGDGFEGGVEGLEGIFGFLRGGGTTWLHAINTDWTFPLGFGMEKFGGLRRDRSHS